jgi:hypothetical protein
MKKLLLGLVLAPVLLWAQAYEPALGNPTIEAMSDPDSDMVSYGFMFSNKGSETLSVEANDSLKVTITLSKSQLANMAQPAHAITGTAKRMFDWSYYENPSGDDMVSGVLVAPIPAGGAYDLKMEVKPKSTERIGFAANIQPSFMANMKGNMLENDAVATFGKANIADTDGDGVVDESDIDDDNDGILDTTEEPNTDGDNDPATNALDTDNDGVPDYLDLDSDADGLPDNIEGQPTAVYTLPSGVDANSDGLDDVYDFLLNTGIAPVNTDGTDVPDYLDSDSDNDTVADAIEVHDHDFDGLADMTPIGADTDGDGLDDAFEGADSNDGFLVNAGYTDPADQLPNTDGDAEVNYRDVDDDNDGVATQQEDENGNADPTDDDSNGNGTPDYLDQDRCTLDATVPHLSQTQADGCPDTYFDLASVTAQNLPNNAVLSWHTGSPATIDNKIASTEIPFQDRSLYAVFYDLANDCYGGAGSATATLVLQKKTSCTNCPDGEVSLGDFVWDDANGNGIQEEGEQGLNGIKVSLFSCTAGDKQNGGLVATTVSDTHPETQKAGYYSFKVCQNSGSYYLVFEPLGSDREFTTANIGLDNLDSDPNINGVTDCFTITDSDDLSRDAGLRTKCDIAATISCAKTKICAGEETTLTASGGASYLWNTGETTASITVSPNTTTTYTVQVFDDKHNYCTDTAVKTITVGNGTAIGNFVWEDTNGNGHQDSGEIGLNGIRVRLYQCSAAGNVNGFEVASTITANNPNGKPGYFRFEICGENNTYYLVFDAIPDGYEFTDPNVGDDTTDSDPNIMGVTDCFAPNDTADLTRDAGLRPSCDLVVEISCEGEFICPGDTVTLTATGGDTFLWNTGENAASIEVSPQATTTYSVLVSNTNNPNCEEMGSIEIKVKEVQVNAGPDSTINPGESVTLNATPIENGDSILWSTGETTSTITVQPTVTTTYTVSKTTQDGCSVQDEVVVSVDGACELQSGLAILPRNQEIGYQSATTIEACLGEDFHIWMFAQLQHLGDPNGEDYSNWRFNFSLPNGTTVMQNDPENVQNNLYCKENITAEDFGTYLFTWESPEGCTGNTRVTLNVATTCTENGNHTGLGGLYPNPAPSGSVVTMVLQLGEQGEQHGVPLVSSNSKSRETLWISLYSVEGKLITKAQKYQVYQDNAVLNYRLAPVAPGKYVIRAIGNGWADSKRLIVK